MQIQGKTALVTGGANGIGFCATRELLRSGAKAVAILDLPDSKGEAAVAELEREFGKDRAIFVAGDVARKDEFEAAFKNALDSLEVLDIWINNAGIMNDAMWEDMVLVGYNGVVRGTLLALDHMGKHKGGNGGTVVNMSSVAGLQPTPIAPIYGGMHAAVVQFTAAMQFFYEKTGVRTLTICPGLTDTQLASKFMSSKECAIDVLDDEMAAREMVIFEKQSAEHVARAIVELIEKGQEGTVCVSENNQPPYALEPQHYSNRKVAL